MLFVSRCHIPRSCLALRRLRKILLGKRDLIEIAGCRLRQGPKLRQFAVLRASLLCDFLPAQELQQEFRSEVRTVWPRESMPDQCKL